MAASSATSPEDVFVNCPFDDDYASTFHALIFAIRACGFRPRCARELDDGGQPRIEKLYDIIQECRYGIHDISRTELDPVNQLPRFNMPLELGIFMGAKRYGRPRKPERRLLIFDTEKYRYQKFISDIAGMDIHAHEGRADSAIVTTRAWLANVSRRQLLGDKRLVTLYEHFKADVPTLAASLGFDPDAIPYSDFDRMVEGWLLDAGKPPP